MTSIRYYLINSILLSILTLQVNAQSHGIEWDVETGVYQYGSQMEKLVGWGLDNSGLVSANKLEETGDGGITITMTDTTSNLIVGMSAVNQSVGTHTIDYGFHIVGDEIYIHEADSIIGFYGHVTLGDSLDIMRTGDSIKYYINDVHLHSTPTNSNNALVLDIALITQGSKTQDITATFGTSLSASFEIGQSDCYVNQKGSIDLQVMGGTAPYTYNWEHGPTTSFVDNLDEGTYSVDVVDADSTFLTLNIDVRIELNLEHQDAAIRLYGDTIDPVNSAGNSWYTKRVVSTSYARSGEDGWFSFTQDATKKLKTIGFGFQNDSLSLHTEQPHLLHLKSTGALSYREYGSTLASLGSTTAGDVIKMAREGSNLVIYKNGNELYTTSINANKKLYLYVNIYSYQAKFDAVQTNFSLPCADQWEDVCLNNAAEDDLNHTTLRTFNDDGEIIGTVRSYFDDMGRPIQVQGKDFTTGRVYASETIYDRYGRAALETMSVPINDKDRICYENELTKDEAGNKYDWNAFDKPVTTNNSLGEVNNPKNVGDQNGTIGWYYSNNNTMEDRISTTHFPYTRTEFSALNPGTARRVGGIGNHHNMGSGHEVETYSMPASGELHYLFGLDRGDLNPTDYLGNATSLNLPTEILNEVYKWKNSYPRYKVTKTITIDPDGNESVIFQDLEGNTVAAALSGDQTTHTQNVVTVIPYDGDNFQYRDIHLPPGIANSLWIFTNGSEYNMYDLRTDELLTAVPTNDNHPFTINDTEIMENGAFLRFENVGGWGNGEIILQYELNYHNFTLNYYDDQNRLRMSIPPLGIDYSYSPDVTTTTGTASWQNGIDLDIGDIYNQSIATPPANYTQISNLWLEGIVAGGTPPGSSSFKGKISREGISGGPESGNANAYLPADFSRGSLDAAKGDNGTYSQPGETYRITIHYDVKTTSGQFINNGYLRYDYYCPGTGATTGGSVESETFVKGLAAIDQNFSNNHSSFDIEITNIGQQHIDGNITLNANELLDALDEVDLFVNHETNQYAAVPTHSMASIYNYNSLGWLLWEVTHDEGLKQFNYRKDGSMRYSQNAKQAAYNVANGKFSYTNYDHIGRPTEVGEYTPAGFNDDHDFTPHSYPYQYIPWATTSIPDDSDPLITSRKSQQTYYLYDLAASDWPDGNNPQRFLSGKLSKSWNDEATTWYSYDERGRIKTIFKHLKGPLLTRSIDYEYDLLGNVEKVIYDKNGTEEYLHAYTYDRSNRLQRVETLEAGTGINIEHAEYEYYAHGPLKRVELGQDAQGIDYTYTVQGSLKAINSASTDLGHDPGEDGEDSGNHPEFDEDLFGMVLHYYDGDYIGGHQHIHTGPSPLGSSYDNFNGNITTAEWHNKALDNETKRYAYDYDRKGQLIKADYSYNNGSWQATTDYDVGGLTYDLNGNILTLERNGHGNSVYMDDLSYSYDTANFPNRLLSIQDSGADDGELSDIEHQSGSQYYHYNQIGQLVQDDSEGGQVMTYDAYGKVTLVSDYSSGNKKAEYGYDDKGFRVWKKLYNHITNSLTNTTYYLRDDAGSILSVYDKPSGGSISQTEVPIYASGRVGVLHRSSNNIKYELTDHLGNVRATKTIPNITNVYNGKEAPPPPTEDLADYYPFGWKMPGRTQTSAENYRFGFQGQFAEEDDETGWNSFEARSCDTRIARWMNPDPLRQFASPYISMGNTPINGFDTDGRLFVFISGFLFEKFFENPWLHELTHLSRPFTRGQLSYAGEKLDYWKGVDLDYQSTYKDNKAYYISGSYSPTQHALARFEGGQQAGNDLIQQLQNGDITLADGETIKLVGHSMGGAFTAGIASSLSNSEYADRVEFVDYISSHGNDKGWSHPESLFARQFSTISDKVSHHRMIPGVTEYYLRENYKGDMGGHFIQTWRNAMQRILDGDIPGGIKCKGC